MKVQVLDIVKRLVKWDKKLEIYTNGVDNSYPERVELLVNNSITAKMSHGLMIQYLIGKGFGEADNYKVNETQKLIDFASDIADDIVLNRGVFIHYDYNLAFEPVNPKVLPFSKCRLGKKDSKEYNGKIIFKNDWNDTKEKEIIYDVYNSTAKIVESQIGKAGSIEKYKGQVFYYNMDRKFYYPLSRVDAVLNDCDSEAQAGTYKNALLRKGFFGKQIIVTPPLIDNDLTETIHDVERGVIRNPDFIKKQTEANEVKETIESFIGAENAGGAMLIQLPDFTGTIDDVFKVITINSEINDKMFEYTENSVSKNILMSFNNLPIALVKSPDNAMLGNSGEALKEAKKMYWENTSKERNILETLVNDIVANQETYNGGYLSIVSLLEVEQNSNEAESTKLEAQANLKGSVGGVQALLQIQQAVSQGLTDLESAVVIISEIYGIGNDLARQMLGTPKQNVIPLNPVL